MPAWEPAPAEAAREPPERRLEEAVLELRPRQRPAEAAPELRRQQGLPAAAPEERPERGLAEAAGQLIARITKPS